MDFESAKAYLNGFKAHERMQNFVYDKENFDLNKLREFLVRYGIDYSKIRFVHVAGSKGKGTVCNLVANYLWRTGSQVGMFTSPYVGEVTECFWLNGREIDHERFAREVSMLKRFLEENSSLQLTFFEALVVIALKSFVESGVEFAVMEVGIGGNLDATNVISADVAAITSIEDEHMEILGGSMEKILEAKLGVLKGRERVVVGLQKPEVDVLARERLRGRDVVYYVEESEVKAFELQFGRAKAENLAIAEMVLWQLLGPVDKKILIDMAEKLQMKGRFEVRVWQGRTIVFDIAHTESSMRNLLIDLERGFGDKKWVFLVSVMKDKKIEQIVELIEERAVSIIFTLAHEMRGENPDVLAKLVGRTRAKVIVDPVEAFKVALNGLNKNEILVVTGSHFLVSRILAAL